MREITLPSGAVLKVAPAPFAASKALYQALLREMKGIPVSAKTDLAAVIKDVFCIGFSSQEIEAAMKECLKRCTYNGGQGDLKIDSEEIFEPVERRDDYLTVMVEVARENIYPFIKSLWREFQRLEAEIPGNTQK